MCLSRTHAWVRRAAAPYFWPVLIYSVAITTVLSIYVYLYVWDDLLKWWYVLLSDVYV